MAIRKQARKQIEKLGQQLYKECQKQTGLVYGSACIALWKYWGWKHTKIQRLIVLTEQIWNECGETDHSMMEMLDDETGIELKLSSEGRSYKEYDFLNGRLGIYEYGKMSPWQAIALRQGQIRWAGVQIQACLYLALHRKYGFGAERIQRLLSQMFEVQDELGNDYKKVIAECLAVTGVDVTKSTETVSGADNPVEYDGKSAAEEVRTLLKAKA